MTTREFRLPDLGEGLTESDIVAWHVAAGDHVELNQVIAEVETAKALVDLPSPYAGVVATLHAVEGQTVNVGDPIVTFEVDDPIAPRPDAPAGAAGAAGAASEGAAAAASASEGAATAASASEGAATAASASADVPAAGRAVRGEAGPAGGPVPGERAAQVGVGAGDASGAGDRASGPQADDAPAPNLVGYGARPDSTGRPARRPRRGAPRAGTLSGAGAGAGAGAAGAAPRGGTVLTDAPRAERPRSTPPVRALAKKLGVRIDRVEGSGPDGLITRADVLAAVSCHRDVAHRPEAPAGRDRLAAGEGGPGREPAPGRRDDARPAPSGEGDVVERAPVRGVRKHTAAAMVASAFTAPHATVFLTVDVTRSVELLERLRAHRLARGTRPTVLALVARALCSALARHPALHSAWHDLPDGSAEIWRHGPVHLGIAVATERGLVVPHVPHADALDLAALTEALAELVATARAGRTAPERLTGGTITITNVGVFGVDAGTPILVPGEAAILGLGAVRRRPWEHDGQVVLRDVVTLSLSFDHRVVDGEQGARFLADVGALLEDPGLALLLDAPAGGDPAPRAGEDAEGPGSRTSEGVGA